QAGLDRDRFQADRKKSELVQLVASEIDDAIGRGINSAPTIFINGRLVRGALPQATLDQVAEEELLRAKDGLARGVPRAKLYVTLTGGGLNRVPRRSKADGDKPALDPAKVHVVPLDNDVPWRGAKEPLVTMVVFGGLECTFTA